VLRSVVPSPPLAIVGMHRSGTSMMTRLLADLGVYVGSDLTGNAESLFFQSLNRSMLRQAGGDWFHIEAVVESMADPRFVASCRDDVSHRLHRSSGLRRFFGLLRFIRWSLGFAVPWGWKDPRNTLTLPVWLELFPDLRVLHIVRSRVDVAISLHRREVRRSQADPDFRSEALDFAACFELWGRYDDAWQRHRRLVESSRRLEIRYESVLEDPETELMMVADFVGHAVTRSRVRCVSETVNQNRLDNTAYRQEYSEQIARLAPNPPNGDPGHDEPA
jgi:hypothetical protein